MKKELRTNITGYFVTVGEDETVKISELIETGRSGVYYKVDDLVSIINKRTTLNKDTMKVVMIEVPEDTIVKGNDSTRYGIKGNHATVIAIRPFSEVAEEVTLVAKEVTTEVA